jgi:biopolymer transport protein ExbD
MRAITSLKYVTGARWLAGLAWVVAMGTSAGAATAKPAPADQAPTKACRAQATSLKKWLATYAAGVDSQPSFSILPDAIELVSIARPPTSPDVALLVTLSPDGATVEGQAVSSAEAFVAELRTALAREQAVAKLTHQAPTQTMLLAVDRRSTWRQVVEAVDAATAAGMVRVQLAFRSTRAPKVTAPGPSAFDERLAAIKQSPDPSSRTAGISSMASELVSACPSLQGPLTAMAKRGGLVPATFAQALLACACAADAPSLATLIWALRPPLPGTVLTLTLAHEGAAEPTAITAGGDLTWAAAHQQVVKTVGRDAAKPVRLQVRSNR